MCGLGGGGGGNISFRVGLSRRERLQGRRALGGRDRGVEGEDRHGGGRGG